ncbi:AAA family ATPase [Actinomadura viridis]|uniref:AAA family ATPase n=1 Tax=Actinomadura viridis TaxID=58110 RepID=UPI0036BF2C76
MCPWLTTVVDEAAMVDDRPLTWLLAAADAAGTKTALVGDLLQIRAIGVGGCFAVVHDRVDGLRLTENRLQRDAVELAALLAWREGDRAGALSAWAGRGS